jgi:hypothetical protein
VFLYLRWFLIKHAWKHISSGCRSVYLGRSRWSSGYSACDWTNIRGFKPGRGRWTVRFYKILSTITFGGEIKPLASCRKILRHVKYPCGAWRRCLPCKIDGHFLSVFPALLLCVSAGIYQRALMDESETIRTHTATHGRSESCHRAMRRFERPPPLVTVSSNK